MQSSRHGPAPSRHVESTTAPPTAIVVGLAGLVCWFHEAWPETAALALVELACGVVLFFEDRYPGNGERPLRGAEWVAADIVVKG